LERKSVIIRVDEDGVDGSESDDVGDEKNGWEEKAFLLGTVLDFDVAVKFKEINQGVLFIKHFSDAFVIVLNRNFLCCFSLNVLQISIGALQQKPPHNASVTVRRSQMQRSLTFIVLQIQSNWIGSQNIFSYNLAV
jgi:hypothetical protein